MFEPQNQLEHSLMQAALEPAHRAQFYRDLLASEILILDFVQLQQSGLEPHFSQTKPFYKRTFFKRLFSK